MANTTEERLMRLETIMEEVQKSINNVDEKLDNMGRNFVRKEQYQEDVSDIKKDINDINRKRWVQNTLSAILGSVLTFLLMYFLQNIGG